MAVAEHGTGSSRERPRQLLAVLVGGTLGGAGREGLALALPADDGIPWAVLVANLLGAFLLGLVLTVLAARIPETRATRELRLLLGTGMLGGFTTYSALAVDTATLGGTDPWLAAGYAVGSVILGLALAAAGVAAGRSLVGRGAVPT